MEFPDFLDFENDPTQLMKDLIQDYMKQYQISLKEMEKNMFAFINQNLERAKKLNTSPFNIDKFLNISQSLIGCAMLEKGFFAAKQEENLKIWKSERKPDDKGDKIIQKNIVTDKKVNGRENKKKNKVAQKLNVKTRVIDLTENEDEDEDEDEAQKEDKTYSFRKNKKKIKQQNPCDTKNNIKKKAPETHKKTKINWMTSTDISKEKNKKYEKSTNKTPIKYLPKNIKENEKPTSKTPTKIESYLNKKRKLKNESNSNLDCLYFAELLKSQFETITKNIGKNIEQIEKLLNKNNK